MYTIDASIDEPIMLIDKHIGYNDEDGFGIDGAAFARELMQLDGLGKKIIHVWINSIGGNVMEGYNIYNAILKSKTKVNTKCIGIAASIAAVIFQAGRERIMCDYGILMYHNPFGTENTEALTVIRDSICTMICERSGMDKTGCLAMMARETFMTASEASEAKLCDRIEGSADYNKKRMTAVAVENNAQGYYKEAGKFLNTLLKPVNHMSFEKIANKLKLVPQANEEAILEGIVAIENRANTAATELASAQNTIRERDTKITDLTNQLATLKGEKETAEKAAKAVQAKALVAGFVKIGVVKNSADSIAKWEEKATADFDGTKELLESIPANKTAVTIQNNAGTDRAAETILEHSAGIEMAKIANKFAK